MFRELGCAARRGIANAEPHGTTKHRDMLTPDELALLAEFEPLFVAEWDRLGISRDDQRWIHAGFDECPPRERLAVGLARLRELATGMGPVAYCEHLGFDYAAMKREIGIL
jgi:hypothetical protein